MNWKFTLVLVAIIAALYVFFTYFEEKQAGTDDPNRDHVFAFDRNQIDSLTILDHDQKIELARGANNQWLLKSPLADRADQSLVDQVFTNLEILRKDDTIPGQGSQQGQARRLRPANSARTPGHHRARRPHHGSRLRQRNGVRGQDRTSSLRVPRTCSSSATNSRNCSRRM